MVRLLLVEHRRVLSMGTTRLGDGGTVEEDGGMKQNQGLLGWVMSLALQEERTRRNVEMWWHVGWSQRGRTGTGHPRGNACPRTCGST